MKNVLLFFKRKASNKMLLGLLLLLIVILGIFLSVTVERLPFIALYLFVCPIACIFITLLICAELDADADEKWKKRRDYIIEVFLSKIHKKFYRNSHNKAQDCISDDEKIFYSDIISQIDRNDIFSSFESRDVVEDFIKDRNFKECDKENK